MLVCVGNSQCSSWSQLGVVRVVVRVTDFVEITFTYSVFFYFYAWYRTIEKCNFSGPKIILCSVILLCMFS